MQFFQFFSATKTCPNPNIMFKSHTILILFERRYDALLCLVFKNMLSQRKKMLELKPLFMLVNAVLYEYGLRLRSYEQWCRSLLSIGGDNLQFYSNFALFSTLEGINLDHDFAQVWKFSEIKKNKKWNTFFPKFR